MPAIFIADHYDTLCQLKYTFDIHQKWRGSKFVAVAAAGHASSEPGIVDTLIKAAESMKYLLSSYITISNNDLKYLHFSNCIQSKKLNLITSLCYTQFAF